MSFTDIVYILLVSGIMLIFFLGISFLFLRIVISYRSRNFELKSELAAKDDPTELRFSLRADYEPFIEALDTAASYIPKDKHSVRLHVLAIRDFLFRRRPMKTIEPAEKILSKYDKIERESGPTQES